MVNELSSLLFTIAGVSAGFIAILGGFIASRLITINSARDVAESNLKEIKHQKFLKMEEKDFLRRSIDEEDSIEFIYEHMEEVMSSLALEEVYEEDELQIVDFSTLLPYWEKAQLYIDQFEECLQKDPCQLNSDMIPCELAEEYRGDPFAYEFLKMCAGWGFSDDIENWPSRTHGKWYEKTKEDFLQTTMQVAALDIQEQRYQIDLESARHPKGMKIGLLIFALFSLLNIIFPLLCSVIPLADKWVHVISYGSIGLLLFGLIATFCYLAQMLRKKDVDD